MYKTTSTQKPPVLSDYSFKVPRMIFTVNAGFSGQIHCIEYYMYVCTYVSHSLCVVCLCSEVFTSSRDGLQQPFKALVHHLCVKVPDKAEYRHRLAKVSGDYRGIPPPTHIIKSLQHNKDFFAAMNSSSV